MAKAALTVVPAILPAKYPQPTVSALAREFNVSRQTIRRWRAKGWKPPAPATIEIVQETQQVATPDRTSALTVGIRGRADLEWKPPSGPVSDIVLQVGAAHALG